MADRSPPDETSPLLPRARPKPWWSSRPDTLVLWAALLATAVVVVLVLGIQLFPSHQVCPLSTFTLPFPLLFYDEQLAHRLTKVVPQSDAEQSARDPEEP